MKTAFVFPGQGAQYVGMAKDFYENEEVSKEIFEVAAKLADFDIKHIVFEENEEINITKYTQAALLTACVAILRAVEKTGLKPDVTAGLSLGEYCALVAANVLSFEDALKIVEKRGLFMQEAVPVGGAMAAVLGLDAEKIEQICNDSEGILQIANYNCPGQIVISGEEKAVAASEEKLLNAGAKRVIRLNVSGPFHSSMLEKAGEQLKGVLEKVTINDITIPYVSNVTADYVTDQSKVLDLLVKQVSSSVRFQQSIEKMIEDGVTTFIEIGPGRTLASFIKKINRQVTVINVEKLEDLEKL